jgi:hypothetical protein
VLTEEDSQTATEDEDDVRARELRKKEVWLQVPPRNSDTETGSETEVKQSQSSTNNNDENNINNKEVSSPVNIAVENGLGSASVDLANETVSRAERLIAKMNVKKQNQSLRLMQNDNNIIPSSLVSLPDAIPSYTNDSGLPKSLELTTGAFGSSTNGGPGNNLPDLITSSPKLSRHSSRLSLLSDDRSYTSSDDAQLKDDDTLDKSLTARLIRPPETNWHEADQVFNPSERNKVNVVVIVTAPTPTNEERPSDENFVEASKLAVPKESLPIQQLEPAADTPTSFDNLIQELRQRKARNKAEAQSKEALKPLATETARLHMSKYFETSKENKRNIVERQDSANKEVRDEPEVKVVSLPMRSKISDKVEKKDMLKYFGGSSFERKSPESKIAESNHSSDNDATRNDNIEAADVDNLSAYGDFAIDEIEREFNEIERQNKSNLDILQSVEINEPSVQAYTHVFSNHSMSNSDNTLTSDSELSKDEEELDNGCNVDNDDTAKNTSQTTVISNTPSALINGVNSKNSGTDMMRITEVLKVISADSADFVKNSPINEYKTSGDQQVDLLTNVAQPSITAVGNTDPSESRFNGISNDINDKAAKQLVSKNKISLEKKKSSTALNGHLHNNNETSNSNACMRISAADKSSKENGFAEAIDTSRKLKSPRTSESVESPKLFWLNLVKANPDNVPPVQKVTIKEQEILPLRATEMKSENVSSKVKSYNNSISQFSEDTPKKPGRRRNSYEKLSLSQPSTPVPPLRAHQSDLRKSLSIRLGRHSGSESPVKFGCEPISKSTLSSPLPRKKNGLLSRKPDVHGSFKSVVDSSKTNKEKCTIS